MKYLGLPLSIWELKKGGFPISRRQGGRQIGQLGRPKHHYYWAREALKDNAWIFKININTVVTGGHIREFFTLWMLVHDFSLDVQVEDGIIWKHANDRLYTAATAYKALA